MKFTYLLLAGLATISLWTTQASPTVTTVHPNGLDSWTQKPLEDVVVPSNNVKVIGNENLEEEEPPQKPRNLVKRDLSEIGNKKIVCYYNYLAAGRPGKGQLTPDKVDAFMCTHIIYCTVGLSDDGMVKSLSPKLDFEEDGGQGGLRKLTNLKLANPELKVLLSVDDGSLRFSKVAASEEARNNFIRSAMEFVTKFDFDGIDLAWKYPADFQGRPSDKRNYIVLLRALNAAFKPKGYLLSAPVSIDRTQVPKSYDIPNMAKYLDLINLLAFDYNGGWDSSTGLHAPLYKSSRYDTDELDSVLNVNWSVNYWIDKGAPKAKLNLGISTFGRTFRLLDSKNNGLRAPINEALKGQKGPYTDDDMLQGYNEICGSQKVRPNRWTVVRVPEYEHPYAYRDQDWISYEDIESVAVKTDYAKRLGLGGLAVISVDTDDFSGHCHNREKFPLTKTVGRELAVPMDLEEIGSSTNVGSNKISMRDTSSTQDTSKPLVVPSDGADATTDLKNPRNKPIGYSTPAPQQEPQKKFMICYYNNMAANRTGRGKLTVDMLDPFLCTHIVYSFVGIGHNDYKIKSVRPRIDLESGLNMINKMAELRKVNPELKNIIAVGGHNEEGSKYSRMVSKPESRATFVQSVLDFLEKYKLDGLAFDWEWPGESDKDNYVLLLKDLRRAFDSRPQSRPQLMATVPSLKEYIDAGFHVEQVASLLDLVNLRDSSHPTPGMTKTKIHSPIYRSKHDLNPRDARRNANWSVSYWIENGTPREKMTLGVGIYGDSYTLANEKETGIGADSSTGPAGRYSQLPGFWGYNEICEAWKDDLDSWKLFRYPECKCPYTFKGQTWIAYDDQASVKKKGHYVNIVPLGGAMVYSLDTDDFTGICHDQKYPLVNAIKEKMNAPSNGSGTSPVQVTISASVSMRGASSTTTTTTTLTSQSTTARPKKVQPANKRTTVKTTTTAATEPAETVTEDPSVSTETPSLPRNNDDPPPSAARPVCGSDNNWWLPGPTCRQYFDCSSGTPKLMSCGEGLAWKQEKLWCDYPFHEPKVDCTV